MRKYNRRGFTLVEVMLFLAITSLLFFGITIGVQNSISEQRYNDSVQNFVEFLRTIYSEVSNVQDIGGGRSERAIYGRLVTFGETRDPSGGENTDGAIFVYDVVGDADVGTGVSESTDGSAIGLLESINANVVVDENGSVKPAGIIDRYTLNWDATINPACGDTCSYDAFKGSLLIIRHPNSGIVYTYKSNAVVDVNDAILRRNGDSYKNILSSTLDGFKTNEAVDFCINPDKGVTSRIRRDVRIEAGARNASGVEVVPDYESVCKKGS